MSAPAWDYIAKLLTIRLCEGRFSAQHDVTIGVEFGSRIVAVGPAPAPAPAPAPSASPPSKTTPKPSQKHMKLSLWDTAGQETYKSVTRSYFRGASGALLVFDITRPQTFAHVTNWLNDLRQIAEPDIVVVLVGNKTDLVPAEQRDAEATAEAEADADGQAATRSPAVVTRAQAERWCREHGVMRYVETSAKSGAGVERAFRDVAERIYEKIEAGRYDLNDRRSGVKGPAAAGLAGAAAAVGAGSARATRLTLADAAAVVAGKARGRGAGGGAGGCC
ncbi:MAG: hypothetical protein M1826_000252 [Phylliscum demangeonii]|nr:MAG: hypothetical protein M1826_000252 [Phylliscum demangeonii]